MNYHTQYTRDTGAIAGDLADYLGKDGVVVGRSGEVLTPQEVDDFAAAAEREQMVRQHSAAFADEHDPDDLANAARAVAREQLGGQWAVGIHSSNPGNAHIHIAQAGSTADCWMDESDITAFRDALASRLGESIGEGSP